MINKKPIFEKVAALLHRSNFIIVDNQLVMELVKSFICCHEQISIDNQWVVFLARKMLNTPFLKN